MRLYFVAFQFLTIIPLPFRVRCEENDLGKSMAIFPVVGLSIGALLVLADFVFSAFFPGGVTDLLLVVVMTVLTGALHLDGLADVCDGLAARGDRERFLDVMKDPCTGAVGAVGVALALLLKYQALIAIPDFHKREALLLFPMISRYAQVVCTVGARRARMNGLGALFVGGAGRFELLIATGLTIGIVLAISGMSGLWLLFSAALLTLGLKAYFQRRLGGITGDIIGCVSELNEIVALLLMVALFSAL